MRRQDRPAEVYYYEWSVNRWRNSETRAILSLAGRGLYRELLDLCYAQGSISGDHQVLAALVGCTPVEIAQFWPQIGHHFFPDPHDKTRLRNKVSDMFREQFFSFIAAQKRSGSTGGKNKARRIKEMSSDPTNNFKPRLAETSLVETRLLTTAPPQQYGDWPETVRAVHESFPDCELHFIEGLARASGQAFAGICEPKCAFSDQLLANAVRRVRKKGQSSAGLFVRTVPACIRTWAAEGLPGQNSDGQEHY